MLKKIVIVLAGLVIMFAHFSMGSNAYEYAGERIAYTIKPFGKAEYQDVGPVELGGAKLNLVIFKTRVLGFDDTERIYSDPQTLLPVRVERDIAWFGKENIIEEYDQKNFTVTIKKKKGKKELPPQVLKSDGPVYNGVLLPFYPRSLSQLAIGWNFEFRLPNRFKVTLDKIEKIKVGGRQFNAYHFSSMPDKFEIWIDKNKPQIPLKIQGKGVFGYTLLMQSYSRKDTE